MSTNGITPNTYISVGLLASIIVATWIVSNSLNSTKSEILARLDVVETKVASLEKYKPASNGDDFYRWTVHLQKENPTLKVPEPEVRNTP